jgi:hypothetical protein
MSALAPLVDAWRSVLRATPFDRDGFAAATTALVNAADDHGLHAEALALDNLRQAVLLALDRLPLGAPFCLTGPVVRQAYGTADRLERLLVGAAAPPPHAPPEGAPRPRRVQRQILDTLADGKALKGKVRTDS